MLEELNFYFHFNASSIFIVFLHVLIPTEKSQTLPQTEKMLQELLPQGKKMLQEFLERDRIG